MVYVNKQCSHTCGLQKEAKLRQEKRKKMRKKTKRRTTTDEENESQEELDDTHDDTVSFSHHEDGDFTMGIINFIGIECSFYSFFHVF